MLLIRSRAVLGATLLSLCLLAVPGLAQEGLVSHRDHTRVTGTVFDSTGEPITDVDIWVMNDVAPADRVRSKTRKTGTYLLRNMGNLFTRDDIEDVVFRIQFEKVGYRQVETTVRVEKNNLGIVHIVMFREDEQPQMAGLCTVLEGEVQNAKGKSVKGASVTVASPDGSFTTEAAVEKDGSYQAVLWNAPPVVKLSAAADGKSVEEEVTLNAQSEVGVIRPQSHDIVVD